MGKPIKIGLDFASLEENCQEAYKQGVIDAIGMIAHAVEDTDACMHCFIKSLSEIVKNGTIAGVKTDPVNFSFRIALARASHEDGDGGT
jgi:4-hydroxy-3-methylbut-2-en-1-yl diphosphate synthase IspG/GcpE